MASDAPTGQTKATPDQLRAARVVMRLVYDIVLDAGDEGAPAGVVYAALAEHGCTITQWTNMMIGMQAVGLLRADGGLLRANPEKASELGFA